MPESKVVPQVSAACCPAQALVHQSPEGFEAPGEGYPVLISCFYPLPSKYYEVSIVAFSIGRIISCSLAINNSRKGEFLQKSHEVIIFVIGV